MSHARERFRHVLSQPTCTVAANIFDPLSARIAHLLDYDVCFLSGSVGKVANLGVPDIVLSNLCDAVDHCRRMTHMADVSLYEHTICYRSVQASSIPRRDHHGRSSCNLLRDGSRPGRRSCR